MATMAPHTASGWAGGFRRLAGSPGRRLAIGVAVGLVAFVGVTIWRMRSLYGLPDVGDPFDVAEALRPVEIADVDNAFVAYAAARRELINPRNPIDEDRWRSLVNAVWDGKMETLTSSSAAPRIRDYLEAKRASLETWREGSRRGDAIHQQPTRMTNAMPFPLLHDTIALAGLAALEGSRLQDSGSCEEAWDWYHALLRSTLMGGRREGVLDQLVRWPIVRYPVQRLRLRASNDVERSRRVLQLVFANWLAQADRPAGRRAPPAIQRPIWLYADDPSAPPAARAVIPGFLAGVIDRTEIARFWFDPSPPQDGPLWEGDGALARERRRRSVLIVRLAAELYRREHGAAPVTAGALLGSILKELPEGIAADAPIPVGLE